MLKSTHRALDSIPGAQTRPTYILDLTVLLKPRTSAAVNRIEYLERHLDVTTVYSATLKRDRLVHYLHISISDQNGTPWAWQHKSRYGMV